MSINEEKIKVSADYPHFFLIQHAAAIRKL